MKASSSSWAAVGDMLYDLTSLTGEAGSAPGAANLFNAPIGSEPRLSTPAPPGTYYVRVRARNNVGVSDPSNEVVIAVP